MKNTSVVLLRESQKLNKLMMTVDCRFSFYLLAYDFNTTLPRSAKFHASKFEVDFADSELDYAKQ